ncbi:iron-containing redox enzyme family protein [bacterium]|nr:iron-containing redox enzyme family protein [bacterium]
MRAYVKDLKKRLRVAENPYLRSLVDGSLSREDFAETQVQFYFAVTFFSRPMAVLAGRLPRADLRLVLLENVGDEHGHGNLSLSHEQTFLAFLERLGVSTEYVESRAMWPEVRAFNTLLAGLCMLDDTETGLAALGVIEDLFSEISSVIGRALVARGWFTKDKVVHYATHEQLDVEHAEGFYRPLLAAYEKDPRSAYQIQQGLELGSYIFLRMYEDLHRARERRWTRGVGGAHSLAAGSTPYRFGDP